MTSNLLGTQTTASDVDANPVLADEGGAVCVACPHRWENHDQIAVRYCTATTANGQDRGCVCTNKETS